jgi:hypothetical protein
MSKRYLLNDIERLHNYFKDISKNDFDEHSPYKLCNITVSDKIVDDGFHLFPKNNMIYYIKIIDLNLEENKFYIDNGINLYKDIDYISTGICCFKREKMIFKPYRGRNILLSVFNNIGEYGIQYLYCPDLLSIIHYLNNPYIKLFDKQK